MALALDVPGPGWKAATLDAWRTLPFLLSGSTAPLAMPLTVTPPTLPLAVAKGAACDWRLRGAPAG